MPLYEYECKECGRRTEKIQKFSDPELTVCPHCGGVLERTLTAPAIQFKGSGWYKDLYSSAKPAAATAEGSKAGGGGDAAAGAKSGESTAPAAGGSGTSSTTAASAPSAPATAAAPTKS
ncbi:MAG TPA: zinc ribbon domain-containing protein [Acidobacteriaceae bacterium]|jgi:putative FmdB family regulatory protein|nr:zinc ribbon domain-containing protein [Acidobacteriaceae bacterium]